MNAEWVTEFDGFLSCDVTLESDVLNIDEEDSCECGTIQVQPDRAELSNQSESILHDFQAESSMCCICWEPFLNSKNTRLVFLEQKKVLVPFALPCLHVGHLCCLAKLLAMRCTQKCCGRCAAPIPEQLFGKLLSSFMCNFLLISLQLALQP
jgi:hypothetical protein